MKKCKLSAYYKAVHKDGLIIWYEKQSDEIVCTVSLTEERGQTWIGSLYIAFPYRHTGLCKELLDYATFNGGDHLSARKSSRAAKIYQTYGFKIYDEDSEYFYMTINQTVENANEIN